MLGYKINTIIFSILTNQIICQLLREGDEDAKNTDKIDTLKKPLYEKYPARNIFDGPSMQEIESTFSSSHRTSEPPLILSLGFQKVEGLNYNRENALFFRHPSDFSEYRAQQQNHRYRPYSYVPYYSFESGDDNEIHYWMEPSYSMGIGFGGFQNVRYPIHFLMTQPPEIKYTGPVLSSEMKNHNLEIPSNSPHIEILKSLSYALPPEITTYYPPSYAKDYFIDVPSPSTTKPQNYDTQSLLLGELEYSGDHKKENEKQTVSYGIGNPTDEHDNPSFENDMPSQYYYSNRRPITFEQKMRKPKNIYEIISAEKIVPKEMDMTVHIARHQRPYPNWKPMIAAGNMAEGSDVMTVKSPDYENVTVKRSESSRENSANERGRSDLEILLTEEAVKRVEVEELNKELSYTGKYGNETENKVNVLSEEEMKRDGGLEIEAQISVVTMGESENTTNNIIDC